MVSWQVTEFREGTLGQEDQERPLVSKSVELRLELSEVGHAES